MTPATLTFEAPSAALDYASPEFAVLRVGKFRKGGRVYDISETDLDRAVENFQRWLDHGQELVIDYDHQFAEAGDSLAAGWFTSVRRVGRELLARVRWTETAREQLRSGKYGYISAEFSTDFHNEEGEPEGFTLLSAGLTNRPFLRGLKVAFSADREDPVRMAAIVEDPVALDETVGMVARRDSITYSAAMGQVLAAVRELRELERWGDDVNPEAMALHNRARQIEADTGVSYEEAVRAAVKED